MRVGQVLERFYADLIGVSILKVRRSGAPSPGSLMPYRSGLTGTRCCRIHLRPERGLEIIERRSRVSRKNLITGSDKGAALRFVIST